MNLSHIIAAIDAEEKREYESFKSYLEQEMNRMSVSGADSTMTVRETEPAPPQGQ